MAGMEMNSIAHAPHRVIRSDEVEVWDRLVPQSVSPPPIVEPAPEASLERVNWPVVALTSLAIAVIAYIVFILCRKSVPTKVNSTETNLLAVQQYNIRLSMLIVALALVTVTACIAMIWVLRPISNAQQPKARAIQVIVRATA